jgi:hypothetical protein
MGQYKLYHVVKWKPTKNLAATLPTYQLQQGDPLPQRPERESKQNFTTYLDDRWQTKERLPTLATRIVFSLNNWRNGEITWHMKLWDKDKQVTIWMPRGEGEQKSTKNQFNFIYTYMPAVLLLCLATPRISCSFFMSPIHLISRLSSSSFACHIFCWFYSFSLFKWTSYLSMLTSIFK